MHVNGRRVLVCDCERTMKIDGRALARALETDEPVLQTHLCRSQIETFRSAVADDEPLLVCCTQEAPLFDEIASEADAATRPAFVNIRERAGWSDEGAKATAKMAALIAEAARDIEPTSAIEIASGGVTLVYGVGQAAIDAARQLSGRLNVTCLLADGDDLVPGPVMDVPVFRGRIRGAAGRLGAFELTIDDFAAYAPSARSGFAFLPGQDGAAWRCDVVVDLSGGTPLFPAPALRDGYVRAEPSDLVAVQKALFAAADLVGTFEKPRYLRVDPAICAHKRNQIVGCDLCLTVCPTGAVQPAGDHTAVDAAICSGHGACASVCPTGAIVFDLPSGNAVFERLRTLLRTYRTGGGTVPVVLVHDARRGDETIALLARTGRGLPANVLPFVVNEVMMIGLDFLLAALAYGAAQVRIIAGPEHRDTLAPLRRHAGLVATILGDLGYDGERVVIDEIADPVDLEHRLYALLPPHPVASPAAFRILDDKRTTQSLALRHLHAQAPAPVDVIALPDGAPFGQVLLDQAACTLCLACVGACPTGALGDSPDAPQLGFTEERCIQCGLCRKTCPENAVSLVPRLNFTDDARRKLVLKQEEPWHCVRCGKPFGTRSTIERLVDRLAGHSMFAAPGRIEILKMCEDCRVIAQFDEPQPMAGGPRPRMRTTEDDLLERARAQLAQQKRDESG